ncbi:MAG: LEPR-XLL domain-containing protein, partial [Planctomycetes bacterium]|nr:LEPR-XLL domain-containing protein [Planctomycetota bacterium]
MSLACLGRWIRGTRGDGEIAPFVRSPSFESLEPRLLLDADLGHSDVLLSLCSPADESTIILDLNQEDPSTQEEQTPLVTLQVEDSGTEAEGSGGVEDGIDPGSGPDAMLLLADADVGVAELTLTELDQAGAASQVQTESQVLSTSLQSPSPALTATGPQDSFSTSDSLTIEARGPPAGGDSDASPGSAGSYTGAAGLSGSLVNPVTHTQMFAGVDVQPSAAAPTTSPFDLLGFPAAYDLRTLGYVTPVQDQGGAGSCWAFGTYGTLESTVLLGGGS